MLQVHSVGWSCDGSRLASGSFDKTVTIWSLESDRLGRDGNYKVGTFCRGGMLLRDTKNEFVYDPGFWCIIGSKVVYVGKVFIVTRL